MGGKWVLHGSKSCDEVEYQLIALEGTPDDPRRKPKISLRSPEVVQSLHLFEAHGRSHGLSEADMCAWMPEYGRWMLEGTPGKPFEGITALTKVLSLLINVERRISNAFLRSSRCRQSYPSMNDRTSG